MARYRTQSVNASIPSGTALSLCAIGIILKRTKPENRSFGLHAHFQPLARLCLRRLICTSARDTGPLAHCRCVNRSRGRSICRLQRFRQDNMRRRWRHLLVSRPQDSHRRHQCSRSESPRMCARGSAGCGGKTPLDPVAQCRAIYLGDRGPRDGPIWPRAARRAARRNQPRHSARARRAGRTLARPPGRLVYSLSGRPIRPRAARSTLSPPGLAPRGHRTSHQ